MAWLGFLGRAYVIDPPKTNIIILSPIKQKTDLRDRIC